MASIAIMIGGAVLNAAAFTGRNYRKDSCISCTQNFQAWFRKKNNTKKQSTW